MKSKKYLLKKVRYQLKKTENIKYKNQKGARVDDEKGNNKDKNRREKQNCRCSS